MTVLAQSSVRGLPGPATLFLAGWAVLWQAVGDSFAIVRLGLYLAPFLTIWAAGCLAWNAGQRRWVSVAVLGPVVVLLALSASPSIVRGGATAAAPSDAITLTTLSNRTRNRDMAATARTLHQHPADILVLQEIADASALIGALARLRPDGIAPNACARGSYVITSRFPVGPPHPESGDVAVFCSVRLPGGRVWIGSVHLPKAILGNAEQARALSRVLGLVRRLDAPVILAGDFNATALTTPIRRAGEVLSNAFDSAGTGLGFTFPTQARRLGSLGAFLRIDHVFLAPAFRVLAARVGDWHPPGADHYPLSVAFRDLRRGRGG